MLKVQDLLGFCCQSATKFVAILFTKSANRDGTESAIAGLANWAIVFYIRWYVVYFNVGQRYDAIVYDHNRLCLYECTRNLYRYSSFMRARGDRVH